MRSIHAVRPNEGIEGRDVCSGDVELEGGPGQHDVAEEEPVKVSISLTPVHPRFEGPLELHALSGSVA
jgi:hypothetical protein